MSARPCKTILGDCFGVDSAITGLSSLAEDTMLFYASCPGSGGDVFSPPPLGGGIFVPKCTSTIFAANTQAEADALAGLLCPTNPPVNPPPTIYYNDTQEVTLPCLSADYLTDDQGCRITDDHGNPITLGFSDVGWTATGTVPAGSFTSGSSQEDANGAALAMATQIAQSKAAAYSCDQTLASDQFSYEPATANVSWHDFKGNQFGNLAFFNANADYKTVDTISIVSRGITSISNLSALPALVSLICAKNSLTALDLSCCRGLTFLDCRENLLTSVDVGQCPNLVVLSVGGQNVLTALDVSGNPFLRLLICDTNSLTTLDLSGNPKLTGVYTSSNALTVLAVNTILAQLVAFGLPDGQVVTAGQTPAAPPSAGPPDGIAAAASLVSSGWIITTD